MAHDGHETRVVTRRMHHAQGVPLTRPGGGSTQDVFSDAEGLGGNGCLQVGGAADEDNIHILVKQHLQVKQFIGILNVLQTKTQLGFQFQGRELECSFE